MDLLTVVGFLPDDLEVILYQSQPQLGEAGIGRLTPLGIFYLLARDPNAGTQLGDLVGQDVQPLIASAQEQLRQKYPLRPETQFAADPQVPDLLQKAVEDAGGINRAGVGHLLLAMLTMTGAEATDVWSFLREHGIDAKKVREAIHQGAAAQVSTLFSDFSPIATTWPEPIVTTETLKRSLRNLTTILGITSGNNALIYGQEGVGRHMLVRHLVIEANRGSIKPFEGWRFYRLSLEYLKRCADGFKVIQTETAKLQKTVVIVDNLEAKEYPLVRPLLEMEKVPVIIVMTATEAKAIEGQDLKLLQRLELTTTPNGETEAILKTQLERIAQLHQLQPALDPPALEALIHHGPPTTGLANPGGAVRLLDLAGASDGQTGPSDNKLDVTDVANVIKEMKGVEIRALTQSARERILALEDTLSQRIVGQEAAKKAVTAALARHYSGLRTGKPHPIGVFFFLGPTGVGKTETAKALAEALFGSDEALIRFDMSEYQEGHTVARLIGSPPGYVGYYEGGQLTREVRRRPYSVVCLDEIDKANLSVLNIFLQLMDDARLTDGQGNTVDFSNTIVIFTSNHGSSLFMAAADGQLTFKEATEQAIEWLRQTLRPEFLNRIDETVIFTPLDRANCAKIVDMLLTRRVEKPFAEKGITIEVPSNVRAFLLEQGFDPTFGARPLERALVKHILDPLAVWLLREEVPAGQKVQCAIGNGDTVVFNR